jgi:hypothetical protein
LRSITDLDPLIKDETYLVPHRDALWQLIVALGADFIPLREKAEADKATVQKVKELTSRRNLG